MADRIDKKLLIKEGVFDFIKAKTEFYFDLDEYLDGYFEKYVIQETFIKDFITLRNSHINNDNKSIRFIAHKFKSCFKLFGAKEISELCEKIQTNIDKGENFEDFYIDLVNKMILFFKGIIELCDNAKKPIKQNFVDEFYYKNNYCEQNENHETKNKFTAINEELILNKKSQNVVSTTVECIE